MEGMARIFNDFKHYVFASGYFSFSDHSLNCIPISINPDNVNNLIVAFTPEFST